MKTYLPMFCVLLLVAFTGCDDDDFSHDPPEGQGSLVIDNETYVDVKVYLDGYLLYKVDSYDDKTTDLDPGTYRVVIDEKGGDHSYRDDIDIIEGKLTVIEIEGYDDYSTFMTRVYFD
jgi:hypothetical protein